MAYFDNEDEVLANRVDAEPPVFRGCSSSEMAWLIVISILVWIPLSVVVALVLAKLVFFLGIFAMGVVITVIVGTRYLQAVKRNKPDHFYVHAFKLKLHQCGIRSSKFIRRSGYWNIDRS